MYLLSYFKGPVLLVTFFVFLSRGSSVNLESVDNYFVLDVYLSIDVGDNNELACCAPC